jgi:hypothetical protein
MKKNMEDLCYSSTFSCILRITIRSLHVRKIKAVEEDLCYSHVLNADYVPIISA